MELQFRGISFSWNVKMQCARDDRDVLASFQWSSSIVQVLLIFMEEKAQVFYTCAWYFGGWMLQGEANTSEYPNHKNDRIIYLQKNGDHDQSDQADIRKRATATMISRPSTNIENTLSLSSRSVTTKGGADNQISPCQCGANKTRVQGVACLSLGQQALKLFACISSSTYVPRTFPRSYLLVTLESCLAGMVTAENQQNSSGRQVFC